jgi:mRNA interferase MazF
LSRGDVVIVATGSGFGGKPRPALIIQADEFDTADTVVAALFTTELTEAEPVRPRYEPTGANGLRETSELMVDIIVTARRSKTGGVIGRLDAEEMARAERALLAILGLAG